MMRGDLPLPKSGGITNNLRYSGQQIRAGDFFSKSIDHNDYRSIETRDDENEHENLIRLEIYHLKQSQDCVRWCTDSDHKTIFFQIMV